MSPSDTLSVLLVVAGVAVLTATAAYRRGLVAGRRGIARVRAERDSLLAANLLQQQVLDAAETGRERIFADLVGCEMARYEEALRAERATSRIVTGQRAR